MHFKSITQATKGLYDLCVAVIKEGRVYHVTYPTLEPSDVDSIFNEIV